MNLFNISIRKSDHEKEDVLNQNKHIRDCHMKSGKEDVLNQNKHIRDCHMKSGKVDFKTPEACRLKCRKNC